MHYTYDEIVRQAKERVGGESDDGYYYAIIFLFPGDSCDNPGSTKHKTYGPEIVVWQIHAMGITATLHPDTGTIPQEVMRRAALLAQYAS